WLGVIQHDMILYDHGMPPGPNQAPNADINVEYLADSKMALASAKLAAAIEDANKSYAKDYPVAIGNRMSGTDSVSFRDLVASVSIREAEKYAGINSGSNPNYHQPTDKFENYSEEDFRFGLNVAKTTLGTIGQLSGLTVMPSVKSGR